jgi:hypothetical protein
MVKYKFQVQPQKTPSVRKRKPRGRAFQRILGPKAGKGRKREQRRSSSGYIQYVITARS